MYYTDLIINQAQNHYRLFCLKLIKDQGLSWYGVYFPDIKSSGIILSLLNLKFTYSETKRFIFGN